tara:strand:- start:299 stop:1258 length:960 start_codon:yes stop_codon:yes gene_type:complete
MAVIRKRKGSYQVIIRKVGHQTLTKSFSTHGEAVRFSKAVEGKLVEKDYDLEFLNRKEYPSFRKCLERYRDEVSKSKRSYDMESKLIKYILREGFSNLRIDRINQKVMAAYRDRALQTLGAASVNRRLAIISHMFSICKKEWGFEVDNAVKNIRKPKNPEPRDRDFSQQELHNLLRGNRASPQMKFIIELAIETGMRRTEIASIKVENLKGYTLRIPVAKTKPRTIPLTKKARQLLDDNLPIRMSSSAIHQAWVRLCKFYKIKDAKFHDIRHHSLKRFFTEKNLDVPSVMLISGHSEPRTLLRVYTKMKAEDVVKKLHG